MSWVLLGLTLLMASAYGFSTNGQAEEFNKMVIARTIHSFLKFLLGWGLLCTASGICMYWVGVPCKEFKAVLSSFTDKPSASTAFDHLFCYAERHVPRDIVVRSKSTALTPINDQAPKLRLLTECHAKKVQESSGQVCIRWHWRLTPVTAF